MKEGVALFYFGKITKQYKLIDMTRREEGVSYLPQRTDQVKGVWFAGLTLVDIGLRLAIGGFGAAILVPAGLLLNINSAIVLIAVAAIGGFGWWIGSRKYYLNTLNIYEAVKWQNYNNKLKKELINSRGLNGKK